MLNLFESWGLGGGGFTIDILRVCMNCESCILEGGFTIDISRVLVNCESSIPHIHDSQFMQYLTMCADLGLLLVCLTNE